jgi:competence protein ComEA
VPEIGRAQLFVYGAIAIALLLIGARWVRSDAPDPAAGGVTELRTGGETGAEGMSVDRGGEDLVVHVAGAVREPGVYRLPGGSRVTDAIERAGGAVAGAAIDAINLAAPLADGQQVQLPERGAAGVAAGAGSGLTEGPISLGTATVEQLDTIEGIGPVTAGDILEFRDERGGIASVEELDEISGIGPATMDALRESLQP